VIKTERCAGAARGERWQPFAQPPAYGRARGVREGLAGPVGLSNGL